MTSLKIRYLTKRANRDKLVKGGFDNESQFFRAIWKEREHISFVSKKPLIEDIKSPFWFNQFAHVISKSKYPRIKYKKEAIVLLTPDEHYAYDNLTKEQIKRMHPDCDWDALFSLANSLLKSINNE